MKLKAKSYQLKAISSQSGVTLLLAILILAAILAISFSLASILLIETKSSSDLLKTEGSLYGATGVGEQALFNLKRGACSSNSPSCYTSQFNNNVVLQSAPSVVTNSNPIFTDKVLPGTNITNTPNKYDFCNVSSGSSGCNFAKVTVNYITTNSGTDQLSVYLCQWDPNGTVGTGGSYTYPTLPCSTLNGGSNGNQGYWLTPASSGSCGTTQQPDGSAQLNSLTVNCATWTLNPSLQQELIFTNPNGQSNIYFSVASFASDGVTPEGLPYVGKTAIDVGTSNGDVGRKIQVVAPNNTAASSAPSSPYVTSITSYGTLRNDYAGWVGFGITVGSSPITVTALGRVMVAGNSGSHTVKIVNAATGVDVAGGSVSVNMSGGTAGSFVYANLSSGVTLSANTSYYIISQEFSGGDQWSDWNSVLQTTSAASDNAIVFGTVSPYTSLSFTNNGFVPLSFEYY